MPGAVASPDDGAQYVHQGITITGLPPPR